MTTPSAALSDPVEALPTDKIPPTTDEKEILEWMFAPAREYVASRSGGLWREARIVLVAALLFMAFGMPLIDGLLLRIVPMAQSSTVLLAIAKALLFGVCFWIVSNAAVLYKAPDGK